MSLDTRRRPFLSTCHVSKNHYLWLWCLLPALALPAQAHDADIPHMCSIDTTQVPGSPVSSPTEPTDCYEFGAAVGELGWSWRKKLPSHVRWVMRKDAPELCGQAQTEFGQKMDSPVPGGCVFLAPTACTIVSTGHISPASIGNAVRDCVP
jgi:hypothetical protein